MKAAVMANCKIKLWPERAANEEVAVHDGDAEAVRTDNG